MTEEELKKWNDRVTYRDYIRHMRVKMLTHIFYMLLAIFISLCLVYIS